MSERMNKERAREILEKERDTLFDEIEHYSIGGVPIEQSARELLEALDIAIESLQHQVNEKDEIKLVCPKCKREWTKPIGEFCSSCGEEMVVEPYERKE